MKRLTGGDIVKARRMRQDFVAFEPSHTAVLITNHLPRVSGDDPAVWRRIRVVPFIRVFTAAEQDAALDDKLRLCADSALSWAIAGYQEYVAIGLAEPDVVLAATTAYQLESDTIGRFLEEVCKQGCEGRRTTQDLLFAFERWADEENERPLTPRAFGRELDRRGFPTVKSTGGRRIRKGIQIRANWIANTG